MTIAYSPWLNGEIANVLSNHISNHQSAAFRAYFISLRRWVWREKRGVVDNWRKKKEKTWFSLGIIFLDWVTYAKNLFLSSLLLHPGYRLSVSDPRMVTAKLSRVPCQIKAVTE